ELLRPGLEGHAPPERGEHGLPARPHVAPLARGGALGVPDGAHAVQPERIEEALHVGAERVPAVARRRLVAQAVAALVEGEDAVARREAAGVRQPEPGVEAGRMQEEERRAVPAEVEVVEAEVTDAHVAVGGLGLARHRSALSRAPELCQNASPNATRRGVDFSFSARELAFAEEARAWVEANVPPAWGRDHCWSRADDPLWLAIARDWQRKLYQGGWAAISWPREHCGRGATVIERGLFEEALDRVGAPRPAAGAYVDLIGSAILRHGTEAQRRRFLARLLSGEDLWCQGFSEPGAGSDLGALRTRGERRGDGFVVNGQKGWTSYAD